MLYLIYACGFRSMLYKNCLHLNAVHAGKLRAVEKARYDYSKRDPGPAEAWLFDIARAKLECQTTAQVLSVIEELKRRACRDDPCIELRR